MIDLEPKVPLLFVYRCRSAIIIMRDAGLSDVQIARVIQDIRSAALNEEFARLQELLRLNPSHHHTHGQIKDAIHDEMKET